jgi:hypothetical protein
MTSKPNTIAKLIEFDEKRYERLSWKNPTPEKQFSFTPAELKAAGALPDQNIAYETGLVWDMITDLAWCLRSEGQKNPLCKYKNRLIYLTGWSQTANYVFRYLNSFAYRQENARNGCVFDGYLTGGAVHSFVVPVNQYETGLEADFDLRRITTAKQPFIAVQTESENGRFDGWKTKMPDGDRSDFKYRIYEVTGASHDTMYSYVNYYQNDPDLIRINHLPSYVGKNEAGNDYPSDILFAAAFRNLFVWVRTGAGPSHCETIPVDSDGENIKDAFGNSLGGLRTCLLNYPTGRYSNTSIIEIGQSFLDPTSDKDVLFGCQESFSAGFLKELYSNLDTYRKLAEKDTEEQISKGFVVREDGERLVNFAVELAGKRGLK